MEVIVYITFEHGITLFSLHYIPRYRLE